VVECLDHKPVQRADYYPHRELRGEGRKGGGGGGSLHATGSDPEFEKEGARIENKVTPIALPGWKSKVSEVSWQLGENTLLLRMS
jgi:hypothetical protein